MSLSPQTRIAEDLQTWRELCDLHAAFLAQHRHLVDRLHCNEFCPVPGCDWDDLVAGSADVAKTTQRDVQRWSQVMDEYYADNREVV